MKKQNFFIFYLENEENQLHSKLVKSYVNYFIINEEDQSEIRLCHKFEKITDLKETFNFLPLHFLFTIDLLKSFLFHEPLRFETFVTISKALHYASFLNCAEYQLKIIIGIPNLNFIQEMILSLIFITEKTAIGSDFQFILLDCHLKSIKNTNLQNNMFPYITCGDDMDILIEEFRKNEFVKKSSDMVSHRLLNSSEIKKITDRKNFFNFENTDNLYYKLVSKRESMDREILLRMLRKRYLMGTLAPLLYLCSLLFTENPYIRFLIGMTALILMSYTFLNQSFHMPRLIVWANNMTNFEKTSHYKFSFLCSCLGMLSLIAFIIYTIIVQVLLIFNIEFLYAQAFSRSEMSGVTISGYPSYRFVQLVLSRQFFIIRIRNLYS